MSKLLAEPSITQLLDSVTPDNSLYRDFNERHQNLETFDYSRDPVTGKLANAEWERLLVVAGTGERKTRLGMQYAVETFLANCHNERAGRKQKHICVIATQFFRKLSVLSWPG